jgi:hypothetical protein
VRLDGREVESRREANRARLEWLQGDFLGLQLDTVLIGNSDPDAVWSAFDDWATDRALIRAHR